MDKRTFLKTIGKGMAVSAAMPYLLGCRSTSKGYTGETAAPTGKNWIWIRPGTRRTDDDWRRIFERLKASGIDAVLPEVYSSNEALFEHPNPLIETKKPVLEQLIPLAHGAGLEIHAWMWSMPNNNPRVIESYPEWFAVNALGESTHDKPAYVPYYKFMCARREGVQEFVKGNVEALSKIGELDGVQLDYIRLPDVILAKGLWSKYDIVQDREYPEYDYCYCEVCRQTFKEQSGIDPLKDLEDPSANEAWRQFRYDGITHLVNTKLVPTAKQYDKTITAAVFPNWESVRQQWHKWNLDGFLPMLYHSFYEAELPWVGEQVQAARRRLRESRNDAKVYSGLFVPAVSPEELARGIKISMEAGANGISLFSHSALEEGHWETMKRALAS